MAGPDSSTQLLSWHSSVWGWFGFGVAVALPPQGSHIGLDRDPPCACNPTHMFLEQSFSFLWSFLLCIDAEFTWDHLHPQIAPTCNPHPLLHVS